MKFTMPSTGLSEKIRNLGGPRFQFGMAFAALAIFTFASALDATLLGNALPTIAHDLNATSLEAFWMSTSFLLAAVAFQPVHTACSDIFGRKPVLYLCCILFTIGIIVFGTANNPTIVILGRTIQGIGGGGLEALSEVILTDLTTLKERPLYLGILSFFWAGAGVAGAPLGGLLAQDLSWRWLAWILLPFMGISLVLIPPFLSLQTDPTPIREKIKRVDWAGVFLFIASSTLVLFAITSGGQLFPWVSAQILTPLIIGIICTGLLVYVELTVLEPVIPPRIFASWTVSGALFGALMHGIILWAILYYVPVYFQSVFLHTPDESSVDSLSFGFSAVPAAIITAFLIEISRRYLFSIVLGWAFATAGLIALTSISIGISVVDARAIFIPSGIGLGMLFTGLVVPVQAGVHVNDVGIATGTLVFLRNLGSTIGVAVGSTIYSTRFGGAFKGSGLTYSDLGIDGPQAAVDLIANLRDIIGENPATDAVRAIYLTSFRSVCIFISIASGLGLLSAFLIKEIPLDNENYGKQAFVTAESQIELVAKRKPNENETAEV